MKRCVLGDRFYQIRVDGRPDWGIKYPFSSSDRCGRAKTYFFFLIFFMFSLPLPCVNIYFEGN